MRVASSPAFRCAGGETEKKEGSWEEPGSLPSLPPLPPMYLPSPQFSRGQNAKTQIP